MTTNDPKMIPLRIRLPYGSEEEFIEKYGSNVARGGVFIATRAIKPEGTPLSFEFVLQDGSRLFRGEGLVVKTQVDEGGSRAGMTVRFSKLDARSKALVDKVIAYRATGTIPLPPTAAPTPALKAEPGTATPPPAAPPQPPTRAAPKPPGPDEARPGAPEPRTTRLEPKLKAEAPPLPSRLPRAQDVVLGIDLGTTNSRIAVYLDGAPRLIPVTSDGKTFALPSVVALDEQGRFVVGARARAMVAADPENTVFGAKRLLGRRARSRKLRELAEHFPYAIVPDRQGDAGVELRGRTFSLPELSALLLTELKQAAQNHLGAQVDRAVLCVPAYFDDHQRSAMREAGKLAGLEVLRIFNEPSAVALAFGYGRGLARKRLLIYDLGGGTFDASIVEVTGDDLEVVSTGGDNFLGGMDFDARVAGQLWSALEQGAATHLDPAPLAAQRIRDAAEQAKIALSDLETVPVNVPSATARPDGSPIELNTELTRSQLEALTEDLVDRTVEVTRAVLEAGGIAAQSLDEVVLVGGQSRAPLVRRKMDAALGRGVRTDLDAQNAVAMGAAILGHALVQAEKGKRGVTLSEVLSAPIGFAVKGGGLRRVLEKNNRLPAEKTVAIPIGENTAVAIAVFQGTAPIAEDNEYLGSLTAQSERAGEVELRFAVSPDGTLEVTATAPGGRTSAIALSTADASDDVREALLAAAPLPGEPDQPAAGGLLGGIKKLFGRR